MTKFHASVINKRDELELYIIENKPSIIGVTESWANCDIEDSELNLEGYELFRKDRGIDNNIHRLQRLQNGLARVVCDIGVRKLHDSDLNSMALLKELHWQPIRTRIEFKVVTVCYTAYRLDTPSYLASILQPYLPSRMLRSSNQDQLTVPASRIKLTSRRFSACAPSL